MSCFSVFKKGDWTFIGVVSVLYYFLIRQYVQIVDDMGYALVHPLCNRRVSSLIDAIESQMYDYMYANGRFAVHTITQYMCGASYGFELFFIFSTLAFAFLVMGLLIILRKQSKNGIDKYLMLVSFFFCMPLVGRTFIGHIAFVVNYLWSCALFVWFYIVYERIKNENPDKCSVLKTGLLFLFGLLFGSWQESFVIPIAVYLFIYYVCHYKDIFKQNEYTYTLLTGFMIGVCVCVFAPSNFERLAQTQAESPNELSKYAAALRTIGSQYFISLSMIAFIVWVAIDTKAVVTHLKSNSFFYCMIAVNLSFAIFIVLTGAHQLILCSLCLSILWIKILIDYFERKKWKGRSLAIFISLALLILLIPIYKNRGLVKSAYEKYLDQVWACDDGCVVAKDLYVMHKILDSDNFFQRYTCIHFMTGCLVDEKWNKEHTSLMVTDGRNSDRIKLVLPDTKDNIIKGGEGILGNGVYELPECKCYVLTVNKNLPWEQSTFETQYKSSSLGRIKQKVLGLLGKRKEKPVVAINIPKYPYDFIAGDYRYVIINLSPDWYSKFKLKEVK